MKNTYFLGKTGKSNGIKPSLNFMPTSVGLVVGEANNVTPNQLQVFNVHGIVLNELVQQESHLEEAVQNHPEIVISGLYPLTKEIISAELQEKGYQVYFL